MMGLLRMPCLLLMLAGLAAASVAHAETLQFASTPGVDEVQVAPSLFSADATSALSSIDETAWQPAVACTSLWTWPWQTDTSPPYATWITDANPPDDIWDESWRWFRRLFVLPAGASGLSGVITWTADNAGLVYVNRVPVGSDGEVFGTFYDDVEWRRIKTYPLSGSLLHEGENEILFLVRNYGPEGVNPTGLIYEVAIEGPGLWSGFADVPPDHWAYDAVMACAEAGIVRGFPDGLYHPGESLNRGQMAVFIARAMAGGDSYVPEASTEATFFDVPSTGLGEYGTQPYWAYDYIEYCAAHDIVQGYWDGSYRPEESVTRAQMAVYIARAAAGGDGNVPLFSGEPTFADVPADHWAVRYVEYCAANGVVQGYWNGYHPENVVTRDQMAVYIARAFELPG